MKLLKLAVTYIISGFFSLIALSLALHIDPLAEYNVYLYKCMIYSVPIIMFLAVLLFLMKKAKVKFMLLNTESIISSLIICFLGLVCFINVALVPIDRSYTIFSLADMSDNSNEVYSQEDVESQFIDVYIKELGSTKRRLDEQLRIGNIEKTEGGYRISEKGIRLVEVFRLVEKIYPADSKTSIYPNSFDN